MLDSIKDCVQIIAGVLSGAVALLALVGREKLILAIRRVNASDAVRRLIVGLAALGIVSGLGFLFFLIACWQYSAITDPFLRVWWVGLLAGCSSSFAVVTCFLFYASKKSIDDSSAKSVKAVD